MKVTEDSTTVNGATSTTTLLAIQTAKNPIPTTSTAANAIVDATLAGAPPSSIASLAPKMVYSLLTTKEGQFALPNVEMGS